MFPIFLRRLLPGAFLIQLYFLSDWSTGQSHSSLHRYPKYPGKQVALQATPWVPSGHTKNNHGSSTSITNQFYVLLARLRLGRHWFSRVAISHITLSCSQYLYIVTLGQDAHRCMENKKLKRNSSMLYNHGHIIKQTAWWCFGQKCLFHYIPGELICLHSPIVDFQSQTLGQTFSFRVIFQCFRGKNVFLCSHEHRFCVQKIPMYLLFFKQPLKRLFPNDTE